MSRSLMKTKVSKEEYSLAVDTMWQGMEIQEQCVEDYCIDTILMLWEEQQKSQPKQSKLVFSRSLNPTDKQIRYQELQYAWKESERKRKASAVWFKLTYTPLTFEKHLMYNNIDLDSYLKKPVLRIDYYSQFSKFNNNVRTRSNKAQVK